MIVYGASPNLSPANQRELAASTSERDQLKVNKHFLSFQSLQSRKVYRQNIDVPSITPL